MEQESGQKNLEHSSPIKGEGTSAGAEQANEEGVPYDPLTVKLPAYEGPFELLLDLIKKNEMDIYNIEISVITKQYLDYLKEMKQFDLEIAGEFLVMAATLIYIKSKMLLPIAEEEKDDEGEDPRTELIRKLLEYQAFREAAKKLGMYEDERGKIFTRQVADYYLSNLSPEDVVIDAFSANLFDLLSAFQSVLSGISKEAFHEVFEEIVSIEQKIEEIKRILTERGSILFRELFGGRFTKNELIATFLALLEIIRSKFAQVAQEKQFGDILISRVT